MIKNKKFLYLGLILFLASMALNIPFPNKTLYGETIILLNTPVKTLNGINYVGITSLLLLIVGLFFLVKSLNKYHIRSVVIVIMIAIFFPSLVVSSFQKTLAKGIYAISYMSDGSKCSFKMVKETTLHGRCELPLENYSKNDVQFNIEFYEPYKDDVQVISLMNNNAPYKVRLKGKERKHVKIETNIDVSKIKNHIDRGEVTGEVNIIIKSEGKSRKL